MLKFKNETDGNKSFLVYDITSENKIDEVSLGMLINNDIKGLAKVFMSQLDDSIYLKYNISSKVPASQIFSDEISKKRIIEIFIGIIDSYKSIEEYMIPKETLQLNLNHIYVDVSNNEVDMICLPLIKNENSEELSTFFKNILFNSKYKENENVDYVAKLITSINSSPEFSIDNFKKSLLEILNDNKSVQNVNAKKENIVPKRTQVNTNIQNGSQMKSPINKGQNVQRNGENKVVSNSSQNDKTENIELTKPKREMTLFKLLSSYSKENLEQYKKEKAEEKEYKQRLKNKKSSSKPKNVNNKKKKEEPKNQEAINVNFNVPGSDVQVSATSKPSTPNKPKIQPKPQNPQSVSTNLNNSFNSQMNTKPANFGETTVLNAPTTGETTVLGASQNTKISPHLIREKNQEKILLT